MRYLLLLMVGIVVAGCDKKEVLVGDRNKISGIIYKDTELTHNKLSKDNIRVRKAISVDKSVDIAGSKQHIANNYILTNEPQIVWKRKIGKNPIYSNLLAADNYIYAINGNGILHCIDLNSGRLIWKKMVMPQVKEGIFVGGMTFNNGIIYIGSNTNSLVAIDTKTRKIVWKKKLENSVKATPFYCNGKIIIINANNHTFALDSKTGNPVWANVQEKPEISMTQLGSPGLYKDNVICVYSTGDIISFKINTGQINWAETLVPRYMGNSSTFIPNISASPIIIGDKCLVVNSFSQMVLFDAMTGVKIWEKDLGCISQPIVADDKWIFVLSDTELLCISLDDGSIIWNNNLKDTIFKNKKDAKLTKWYGPLLVNGEIWLFSNSAFIAKFDIKTGKCINSKYIHHMRNITDPIIINETLYANANGSIYALR